MTEDEKRSYDFLNDRRESFLETIEDIEEQLSKTEDARQREALEEELNRHKRLLHLTNQIMPF